MKLYLLRHAIAAEKPAWHGSDSDRPLTKEGIRKMKKAAKGMRHLGLEIDWILTSPYRRAYDTALIAAEELKARKKLKITRLLAVDGDPKALMRHLALDFRSWESIMLVGHEPYLSRLIGTLIAGEAPVALQMDKGGLARLSADSLTYGPCATLEWLLPAKLLKAF
jgi:phosphohistidine phosphatase